MSFTGDLHALLRSKIGLMVDWTWGGGLACAGLETRSDVKWGDNRWTPRIVRGPLVWLVTLEPSV